MNRLQKKCVIATAGVHLLLIVILFVGPAFFSPKPKADDLQVLDVIPANLIDAQFNSGVANATPPPPAPVAPPQPPPPTPVVTPPAPAPAPEKVEKAEPVKPPDKLPPEDLKPVDKTSKVEPRKSQINTQLVTRVAPRDAAAAAAQAEARAEAREQQRRAQAIRTALRDLKGNLTSATVVDAPGSGSAAYANYRDVVGSIYYAAWTPPDDAANDDAITRVSVTIASDGTVVSARIVTPSGDAGVDNSIQRALERVTFIAPFPEGATEKERTFVIKFNLKAKRMLG
ncbi:MAG: TonB family protein [Verrucomicrobiia bacterium]|jgi:protein TonB